MAHGSWLKATGSCLKARGSRPRNIWRWVPQEKFERPSAADQARAAISSAREEPSISSAPAVPSEFERPFRAPQRSRAGSSGHFEGPSRAERARAAISRAPAEPTGLEQPFRAPQRSRAGSMSQTVARAVFSPPGRAELSSGGPKVPKPSCGNFELDNIYNGIIH